MRVAIYARFSSDLQDVRSITDQVAAARDHATRQGWRVVAEFSDAAISGASLHNRPGLLDLLVAAQAQQFDAVLTESIDRLSRDLEDIAGLHKRLAYWGVKIVTLADGEVGKLHVGLKGIIASIYLDDLAQKTRRGQVGRVRADASRVASATVTTLSPPARTAGSGRSTRPRPRSSGGSSGSMSMAARLWRLRGG
jgi:site-specific DNA recombinase